eukprot:1804688-Amphidinium_carterae.1
MQVGEALLAHGSVCHLLASSHSCEQVDLDRSWVQLPDSSQLARCSLQLDVIMSSDTSHACVCVHSAPELVD